MNNGPAYKTCPTNLVIPKFVYYNNIEFSVVGIGRESFSRCRTNNLTIPNSLRFIEYGGLDMMDFKYFSGIPQCLERIEKYALSSNYFDYCTIPKSLISIGIAAFCNLPNLAGFSVDPENPNYCSDEFGSLYTKDQSVLIHSPSL